MKSLLQAEHVIVVYTSVNTSSLSMSSRSDHT